jgi:circadian clock protein KaiC
LDAKCSVLDGINVLLDLLNAPVAVRQEIYRLREWLLRTKLMGIITQKVNHDGANGPYSFLQFMVDSVIVLQHQLVEGSAFRLL